MLRIRPGKASWTGWAEHGAEPGHDDHVDPGGDQRVGHGPGVPLAVEPGAESAVVGPVDQDRGDGGGRRHVEGPARAVGGHQVDRQTVGQDGLEDGAAARDEHADPDR